MSTFVVSDEAGTSLFAEASKTSKRLADLNQGEVLRFPQGKPGDDFVGVIFAPEGGIPISGFVLRSACKEIPDGPASAIDREAFVRECLIAEVSMNALKGVAPWVVVADFLIARALVETDLTNAGEVVKDGIGPLQVTTTEWKAFHADADVKSLSDNFLDADRIFPTLQVYGAACRMHQDGKAISTAKTPAAAAAAAGAAAPAAGAAPPASAADGVFLASYLDLFHSYLTNSTDAAMKIADANDDDAKKKNRLDTVLTADQIALVVGREKFKGKADGSTAIADFVTLTEGVLGTALKDAFDLIKQFAPEQVPAASTGPAPWFDVALAEEKKGISNAKTPDAIKAYFAATDFGPVGAGVPNWCGAFVANCIKASNSGAPIPKGAAVAANWKNWGQSLPAASPDTPVGAVVVLTPSPGTNTSGHVSFFASTSPDKVTLLGGNQHESVNHSTYSLARVVAVRWVDTSGGATAATGKFNLKATGVPQKFWQFAGMIADMFARAGYTNNIHQAAAIANAIAESGLDPNQVTGGGESSVGLFQCNQNGGLGAGRSTAQLQDPATNIQIILTAVGKVSQFKNATNVNDAVSAFVTFVERPKHPEVEIPKRQKIAAELMSSPSA